MRIDRFTGKLQSALADAQSLAAGRDHNYLTPIHLVSALLKQLTEAGGDIEFGDGREVELKGLGQQQVFQVEWSS